MRKLSILICLILISTPLAITQANAAAPKLGGTCSKVGSFGDTPNVRFVCVKISGKLVWQQWNKPSSANKGSATPTPVSSTTTTPKPTPTVVKIAGTSCATDGDQKIVGDKRYVCEGTNRGGNFLWDNGTPTSFQALMPIALPVAQDGTITFTNALSHINEIPTVAWQRIQKIIDASSAVDVPHQLLVGPHTTTVTKTIEENILSREFKLWSGFQQTKYLTVIAYSFEDMDWAATTHNEVIKNRSYPGSHDPQEGTNRAKQSCDIASKNCDAGNAGQSTGTTEAIEFIGVTTSYPWDPTQNGEVGHEYTHTLTAAQFNGTAAVNTNYYQQNFTPCWMNEGFSNASGIGASTTSLQQYLSMRDYNVARPSTLPSNFQGFSAAGLKDYLYSQVSNHNAPNSCYNGLGAVYQLGYSIGYAATEALFAIGGPHSVLALVSRGAMGDSFSQAFQNVYGMSWDEGSTILGQILAAEYAAKPMRAG